MKHLFQKLLIETSGNYHLYGFVLISPHKNIAWPKMISMGQQQNKRNLENQVFSRVWISDLWKKGHERKKPVSTKQPLFFMVKGADGSLRYNPLTISCVTLALSRLVGSIEAIKQPTNRVVPADHRRLQVVELLFLGIFVGEENASEVFWLIVVGWWRGWGLDVGRCSCRGWGSMKKALSCKNLFWVHSEGQWRKTAVNPKV